MCYQLNYQHGSIPDTFEFVLPAHHQLNPILPLFKRIENEEVYCLRRD